MFNDKEQLVQFLRQYAEGEPEIILDLPLSSAAPSDTEKFKRLQALEQKAQACTACRLANSRKTVVFGEGSPDASIMFVGEGPGADEDEQGRPFVGRAGQLLDKIISAMGFQRGQVYIGNIVKCRPPGNREPAPDEAHICLPFIREQIEIIAPKVLVGLGKTAAVYLMKAPATAAVKSLREERMNYKGIPLVITYHPAALLRTPEYKAPTWQDMQNVLKVLAGEMDWKRGLV